MTRRCLFEKKTSEQRLKEMRTQGVREGLSVRGNSRWKGPVAEGRDRKRRGRRKEEHGREEGRGRERREEGKKEGRGEEGRR